MTRTWDPVLEHGIPWPAEADPEKEIQRALAMQKEAWKGLMELVRYGGACLVLWASLPIMPFTGWTRLALWAVSWNLFLFAMMGCARIGRAGTEGQ